MAEFTSYDSWAVDGVSIQTLAWNISSWGGDRQGPPPMRGENITIPHAPGALWQPKIPDSRSITLNMWVEGCNSDGTIPQQGNRRAMFEDNFATLRSLFWNPYRQINLTKSQRIFGTSTRIPVTARAQYQDGFAPQMFGSHMAQFSVTLFLADPFFYGDVRSVPMNADQTIIGDARTEDILIKLPAHVGILEKTNQLVLNNNGGADLNLDVRAFSAKKVSDGTKRAGDISHKGGKYWMALDPGTAHFDTGGANGVTVSYRPRFF